MTPPSPARRLRRLCEGVALPASTSSSTSAQMERRIRTWVERRGDLATYAVGCGPPSSTRSWTA